MNFDNQEYEEHILISTGNGIAMMPHHIMKLNTPKFSFDSLTKPIKLTRKSDLPQEEEQKERTIHRSKKSKAFFLGREDQDVVLGGGEIQPGTLIAPIGSRYADPDKSPWILRDAEQHTFQGTVEGSQSSNYVLFVNAQNGFKVIPVQKWYKFSKKVEPKVTSLEEAEEKLKTMKQDRWTAHEETKKSWKEKLMNIVEDVEPKKSKKVDLEDIGMDFEEQMSDDEDVDFGIENEEEAKEAQKRVLKEEEASTWKSSLEKKLARSLAKRENTGVYDDYGPENPYWTDEEEEEEEIAAQVNDVLEKAKVKIKKESSVSRDSPKPEGFKIKVSMANEEQPAKKQKIEQGSVSNSNHIPPPPPSAAQVVAKAIEKERKRKRVGSRGLSPSPAPSSPKTPPSLPSTPPVLDDSDPTLMTEDDLIRVVKKRGGSGVTVKEIVSDLKSWFLQNAEKNKQRMRILMKRCLDQDKKTFSLKKSYHDWVDPKA